MTSTASTQPWLVCMHHRMRTAAFGALFVAACLQLVDQGPALLLPLGLLLLSYPQIQYWRTRHDGSPIDAELRHLMHDAVLVGLFTAAVEFSLWLSFSALLGTLMNNVTNRGLSSIGKTLLCNLVGALLWIAVFGWRFTPDTEPLATAMCVLSLSAYLLELSHMGFKRNAQLRQVRETLRQREKELLAANDTLRHNLTQIHALQCQVQEQADRDPLTNLYNRRYLDLALEREFARCQRDGKPLAFVMIDVDHFKHFNDAHGHQAGDACLQRIAAILQAHAKRANDLAARYGGEEFSLVLPDTDLATAQRLAHEIRQAVEALAMGLRPGEAGHVTLSLGVAVLSRASHPHAAALVHAADQAVYRAKRAGRNQVCLAG